MAELRFGTYLAPRLLPLYEAVAATVGSALGMTSDLVAEQSFGSFVADANDVSFVCGLPYVAFERDGVRPAVPVAAPVPSPLRYGGRPIYFSDVIVREETPYGEFPDLRGSAWAYSGAVSQSGYGVVRHHLLRLGETGGFFGRVVCSGSHDASIEMVLAGTADAAAIDSHLLDVAMAAEPELRRRLRVVAELGPSTIQPVVVSRRLSDDLREAIADAVVSLHEHEAAGPALAGALVERFVVARSESYDDVRAMVEDCEQAGFTEVR